MHVSEDLSTALSYFTALVVSSDSGFSVTPATDDDLVFGAIMRTVRSNGNVCIVIGKNTDSSLSAVSDVTEDSFGIVVFIVGSDPLGSRGLSCHKLDLPGTLAAPSSGHAHSIDRNVCY